MGEAEESTKMEPEIFEGECILEQFKNIVKRTPDSVAAGDSGEEFEAMEHENIGNKINLRFPANIPSSGRTEQQFQEILGSDKLLRLPNSVALSFGQIVALAGDFYGIPHQPIINPSKKQDKQSSRKERFIAAYNTLARAPEKDIKKELDQILEIMTKEKSAIQAALENQDGSTNISKDGHIYMVPSEVYEELGISLLEKWDKITGGKWFLKVPIIFGRIMKLAENNHDHFLPYAKDAYLTGHELALEKAKEASTSKHNELKMSLLEEAYSMDAFACHFLTDSFSSGHIRTPRIELGKKTTPAQVGHLLCKYMHDEDNKFGLRVTNAKGDKWIAYGDGMLLNNESEDTRRIAVDAVQTSVDQVYEAFLHPEKAPNPSLVTDYMPVVDTKEKNNYPMFQVKDSKLLRRSDLKNLGDSKTVSDWIGLTTVMQLRSYQPKNSAIEDFDEEFDCRSCSQSLNPKLAAEHFL